METTNPKADLKQLEMMDLDELDLELEMEPDLDYSQYVSNPNFIPQQSIEVNLDSKYWSIKSEIIQDQKFTHIYPSTGPKHITDGSAECWCCPDADPSTFVIRHHPVH